MRACWPCLVKWDPSKLGRACPVCHQGEFWTMNMGDLGFAMQMDSAQQDISAFQEVTSIREKPSKE